MNSFIKKITSVQEWQNVIDDLYEITKDEPEMNGHAFNFSHDSELIKKCMSHESLLIWNIHVWAHFNGEKWDGIFIASIRKNEKFNKKSMDEYVWFCKNSNKGIKLLKTAIDFAKEKKCDYISLSILEKSPKKDKLKSVYKKLGFEKDSEVYFKKI